MDIRIIDNGHVQLLESLKVSIDDVIYTVPSGFIADGASVPRFFWLFGWTPLSSKTLVPSFVHDYLYRTKIVSRFKADVIFLRLMKAGGVNTFRRWAYFIAVRLFAWAAWNQKKEAV